MIAFDSTFFLFEKFSENHFRLKAIAVDVFQLRKKSTKIPQIVGICSDKIGENWTVNRFWVIYEQSERNPVVIDQMSVKFGCYFPHISQSFVFLFFRNQRSEAKWKKVDLFNCNIGGS